MKILIFANSYENYFLFRKSLINHLLKKNFSIYVILPTKFKEKKINLGNILPVYIDMKRHGKFFFNELILLYKIYNIYKKIKPDYALHFTIKPNIYGSIACRLNRIKNINNITGLGTVFLNNKQFFYIYLYKIALKNSYHTFFQNKYDQRYFKIKKIVTGDNSVIPGSGVLINNSRIDKNPNKNEINFLFIGRLIIEKGIHEFLKAAEFIKSQYKYKKINFNVVGSLDSASSREINKEYFNKFINKKIINYLGYKDDLNNIISEQHCIILPSYREGMSHSLLMAGNLSKALIVTNVPGCKELVTDNYNGFLCKKKNVYSLVNCIKKFINLNFEDQIKFGTRSRELVKEKFNEKIVIKSYLKMIK